MPYTQAVLQEVLRLACPVPATGRAAGSDVQMMDGLTFPKASVLVIIFVCICVAKNSVQLPWKFSSFYEQGTFIAINIYSLHRDESVWEDPFTFKPERFLDDQGKLVNFEKTLVYGYGNNYYDQCDKFFMILARRWTSIASSSHFLCRKNALEF